MKKRGIEIGFNWLFAIIAGGAILFLAIYISGKFIGSQQNVVNTETAAQLVSLLDPLETGLASGKASQINFVKEAKTLYDCDENANEPFGTQTISFREKVFDKFLNEGQKISIKDKYIFAENEVTGKDYFVFSKPFYMSYKVSDIIIIGGGNYCFYAANQEVKDEINRLNLKNVIFANSSSKCEGISVCFDEKPSCDIKVSMNDRYVQKKGKRLYFTDSLIYGAIFSSLENYECNAKRLKNKFDELAKLYIDKTKIIQRNGCESNIGNKLISISGKISSSRDLVSLEQSINDIDVINKASKSDCQLY